MKLVPIEQGGDVAMAIGLPVVASEVLSATAKLYASVGYAPPWICYIAETQGTAVGTCGFKSAPANGRVEMAYFTFPGYEGKGIATQMGRMLVKIAHDADAAIMVTAQTLPARNASHRVLEKLGFSAVGTVQHPEDGPVLEWHERAGSTGGRR